MAIYLTLAKSLEQLKYNLRIGQLETGIYQDSTFQTAYLNMGQKTFIRDTRALGGNFDTSIITIAEQREYNLWAISGYFMIDDAWEILVGNNVVRFKDPKQIYAEYGSNWQSSTSGSPQVAYLRGKKWFGLNPKPSTDYAGLTIALPFIKRPTDMVNTTDTPFDNNPYLEEYTEAPIHWAAYKLFLRAKQYNDAGTYKTLYESLVKQCKEDMATDEPKKFYLKPAINNDRRGV